MYARAECLREGIALVCGRRNMRDSHNGARMRLIRMPAARIIRAARIERVGRGIGQRAANMSQITHWIQRNRQTGEATTSTSKHPLSRKCLPDLSLQFKQSCPTSVRAIRLQQRCNPDARLDGAYTSFPPNLQIWRGWWRRPCVECAFYSYTRTRFVTKAKQLYIQNEGLSEIF